MEFCDQAIYISLILKEYKKMCVEYEMKSIRKNSQHNFTIQTTIMLKSLLYSMCLYTMSKEWSTGKFFIRIIFKLWFPVVKYNICSYLSFSNLTLVAIVNHNQTHAPLQSWTDGNVWSGLLNDISAIFSLYNTVHQNL